MTQNEHLCSKHKMETQILYSEVCVDGIKVVLEMTGIKFQSQDDYLRPNKAESEVYIYRLLGYYFRYSSRYPV